MSRREAPRDTAKDIILGLEPSGKAPRRPREGIVAVPQSKIRSPQRSQTTMVQRPDNATINNLQNQVQQLRRQQSDLQNTNEVQTRRRLEANQNALNRRMASGTNAPSNRDFDELRRQLANLENRILLFGQELSSVKGSVDRHSSDLLQINNDFKTRPLADQARVASNNQQMDLRIRDLHSQLIQVKQALDSEVSERIRSTQSQADTVAKLNEYIRQQEASKNELLHNVTRRNDLNKEKLNEEARRLNDRIQLITTEVAKTLNDREQRIRDDLLQKYNGVQMSVKSQFDSRLERENELQKKFDERHQVYGTQLDELRNVLQQDRNKYKDRFHKVNEALAALETRLEIGNKKIDKIMNAEIQSRKLHEKGLLGKVNNMEERLNSYLNNLSNAVDEVRAGNENVKLPAFDTEALRREMEAISADKNKMSMEGLLKLEEKISRMQHALNRDRRELQYKLGEASENRYGKVRNQITKLDELIDDVERVQDRVRDKVERQIPQDLNELSAKVDNVKQQLTHRIDQEEEESCLNSRYLAIKELQDAYGKIAVRGRGRDAPGSARSGAGTPQTPSSLRRDIDECKVAIKKLAESVTTVKNVLDRRIQEEIRKREQDVETLTARADALAQQQSINQRR
ncbi:hypothetical protein M3Y95_00061000 [Aphelenchoides besseyi]|nr:hypothetical protein M3Y95_00061000 [Aphelenchoides besseyi]